MDLPIVAFEVMAAIADANKVKSVKWAAASGLSAGYLYQTDGTGASPLDVAGIVMIKQ